jgi:antitoxin component of MazEF toxin-antitoxin module
LAIRPIHHQLEHRIESHMLMPSPPGYGTLRAACGSLSQGFPAFRLISFLAYCLQVPIEALLKARATGLTPRAVLEKFAAVQMLEVHLPTTNGREIVLTRYTQPEKDLLLLLEELKMTLPEQAPPKIYSTADPLKSHSAVVPTF